jgi:uncharacterized membrane protein
VILGLTIGDAHGLLRLILGFVLSAAIPGWSVVGPLKLRNVAVELSLTIAVSLCLIMIAAQIMVTAHSWHPIALEEITCVACIPSLLWQSSDRIKTTWRSRWTKS